MPCYIQANGGVLCPHKCQGIVEGNGLQDSFNFVIPVCTPPLDCKVPVDFGGCFGCLLYTSIARVMLRNTPIIILDEATAFADPDNEARVQEAVSYTHLDVYKRTGVCCSPTLAVEVGGFYDILVYENQVPHAAADQALCHISAYSSKAKYGDSTVLKFLDSIVTG